MRKKLSDLIQVSCDTPSPDIDPVYQPPVIRGSATDNQLLYLESLAHGFGEHLAEIRFGRSLIELSSAEASMIIETLTG
jgi:hypothetical protein